MSRLYDEKEIAAILRAAADESATGVAGSDVGLSIDELEQIGSESGLDAAAIRRAAARLDTDTPPSRSITSSIWGGPVAHERTWTIDRELTPGEWELVLADIRRAFGVPGSVSVREGAFEWIHKTLDSFTAHVTATVHNGRTTFHAAAGDPPVPLVYFAPAVILSFLGLPIMENLMNLGREGIVLWAVLIAVLMFGARSGVTAHARRNRQKIDRMVVDVDRTLERTAAPAEKAPEEALPEPEPPVDLFDGMPEASSGEEHARQTNRSETT